MAQTVGRQYVIEKGVQVLRAELLTLGVYVMRSPTYLQLSSGGIPETCSESICVPAIALSS